MGFDLQCDDVSPDQFVAISRGVLEPKLIPFAYGVKRVVTENQELNGLPIQVLGVSRPFVIGRFVHNEKPVIVDMRTVKLAKLDDGYVAAVIAMKRLGEEKSKCDANADNPPPPDLIAELVPA